MLGRDFNSRGMETCRGLIPPPRRFVGPCAGPCCGALPALCGSVSRRTAVIASTLLFVVRVEVSEHVLATSDTSDMLLALMSAPNVLLQRDNARCRRGGGGLQERFHPDGAEKWKTRRQPDRLGVTSRDTLAERLRRRPAKPMGSPRVGSNPTGVVLVLSSSSTSRGNFGWAWVQHVQKFLHSICVGVLHEWAACHGKQGGGRSFELTGTSSWRLQRTAPCVSAGQEGGSAAAGNSTQFPDANWCGESASAGPGVILSPWVAAM